MFRFKTVWNSSANVATTCTVSDTVTRNVVVAITVVVTVITVTATITVVDIVGDGVLATVYMIVTGPMTVTTSRLS